MPSSLLTSPKCQARRPYNLLTCHACTEFHDISLLRALVFLLGSYHASYLQHHYLQACHHAACAHITHIAWLGKGSVSPARLLL